MPTFNSDTFTKISGALLACLCAKGYLQISNCRALNVGISLNVALEFQIASQNECVP